MNTAPGIGFGAYSEAAGGMKIPCKATLLHLQTLIIT
jgi:hypothetical protein